MNDVEASGTTIPGETTDEITNEDFLWLGPENDVNAVLLLDGTSGTSGDFGADGEKTGGRLYVETIGKTVKEQLTENPEKDLEEVMQKAIEEAWNRFQEKAEELREKYFSGKASKFPNSTTVPGAVGSLVRWDGEKVEILHIGDLETYIVKNSGEIDFFANEVHQRFDEIMNQKITELREKGIENPEERPEVHELMKSHRSASNFPGTYPQIGFNPLVIEKQGEKKAYDREKIDKIVLGSDGATVRMKYLFELDNRGLLDFVEEKGIEKSLSILREEEDSRTLDELKNSDDAALAVIKF